MAVAAAAAIVVAVEVAGRPPELEQGATPQVSRLEGFHATGVVAADDSLWVTQHDVDRLLRIDLQTGEIRARVDVGGSLGWVTAAAGAAWVHDWERGRLLKVDERTNRVVKTLAVGRDSDFAFAAGSLWGIGEQGLLLRVDPGTAAVTQRLSLGGAAPSQTGSPTGLSLAAAGDILWVVTGAGDIIEVDAGSGRILGRVRGPAMPLEASRRTGADDTGLWISSPARREVLHVDARTRELTRFPVPGDPGPLAVVDGRIWVGTLHDTGTLMRVTVLEGDGRIVGTIPVPHRPLNIVPSPGGGAWVTFGENDTVSPAAVRIPSP